MVLNAVRAATRTTLYYLCLPFILLLQLIWAALLVITAPVLHVALHLLHATAWPFRQLAKLETLYIYFGVAVLLGILLGAILHYSFHFIVRLLGIDREAEERGRTLASYRVEKAERQARKAKQTLPKVGLQALRLDGALKEEYTDWLKQDKGARTRGLLSTTILEEDDSSEAGF